MYDLLHGPAGLAEEEHLRTREQLIAVAGHWRRFIRFGIVGASGAVVNFFVLTLLVEIFGLHPLISAVVATETAILTNFVLNDRWTFRDVEARAYWLARAARYNLFALGGLLISVGVLAALTELLGLHYLIANVFAIGVAMFWNYGSNARWTWPGRPWDTPAHGRPHPARITALDQSRSSSENAGAGSPKPDTSRRSSGS